MINEKRFRIRKDGKPYSQTFCTKPELIENYDKAIADKTQTWECHHRNEKFYTMQELIDLGLYYDCPPCELIFLTLAEHNKEYHKGKAHHSEEAKQKIKEKRAKQAMKPHSEETKEKMRKVRKGKHRKLVDVHMVWF